MLEQRRLELMRFVKILLGAAVVLIALWVVLSRSSLNPHRAERLPADPSRWLRKDVPPESSAVSGDYGAPVELGTLEDRRVGESSGLVASRRNSGLFWTHNDSGDGPYIYAVGGRGEKRGVWRVAGAESDDWEDIAAGPGPERGRTYLYIGDIGDNGQERAGIVVYRVPEPAVEAANASSTKDRAPRTDAAEAIRLKYPDGKHNAETLLVHPATGDIYVVTKSKANEASGVYKLAAPFPVANDARLLVRVGEVRAPSILGGLLTGGDISPDGRRVVFCDYVGGYELVMPRGAAAAFDDIWKQPPVPVVLAPRQQGEAICYRADGAALITTSENLPTPLAEIRRKSR